MEKKVIPTGVEGEAPVADAPTIRKYRAKILARYSDANPQTEQEWADLEDKYADEVEGELDIYKTTDKTLTDKIQADPELGQFLHDLVVNNVPFRVAVIKTLGSDELIPKEGDDDYEAWQSVGKEKAESASKRSVIDKEIETNQDASIAAIDTYSESKGYSEEQKNTLLDFIDNSFQDLLHKKVSEPILAAFDKAMNYDADISAAAEAAKIEGKNEAIDIKKAKDVNAAAGDGIPVAGKGGVTTREIVIGPNQRIFGDLGRKRGI